MATGTLSVPRDNAAARGVERTPIIRMNGVTKRFPVRKSWNQLLFNPGRREFTTVLDDVSLSIGDGEFFGLLGRNGAGKTTLFRILSTLVLPESGSVNIAGADALTDGASVRSLIAPVVASERSLNWRLTAQENLRLYAVLQRVPARDVGDAVSRALQVVSLTDTGNKMVGTFSSGMRQRLLIARALLGRPRILLLDEPTRSLDPLSARDFRIFLRETIVGVHGCTVLLATHDADDVWNLCDRVAVLDKGKVLAIDNTDALRMAVGDDIHSAWIRSADLPRHNAMAQREGISVVGVVSADEEWSVVRVELAGNEMAASYLASLAAEHIGVSRLERSAPDLAELIERVLHRAGT